MGNRVPTIHEQDNGGLMNRRCISRRAVLRTAASVPAALVAASSRAQPQPLAPHPVRIAQTDSTFEREPLVRPFGFKGG
jgi:hypothetical protein